MDRLIAVRGVCDYSQIHELLSNVQGENVARSSPIDSILEDWASSGSAVEQCAEPNVLITSSDSLKTEGHAAFSIFGPDRLDDHSPNVRQR